MLAQNVFDRYLSDLRKTPIEEKTEHTDRTALQTFLQTFAGENKDDPLVQHEPKRVADKGAPDFKVTKGALILGYVENKTIGENLGKVLKSDQIEKYKTLSQNIILTDYLHFIWIKPSGIQRETLLHESDLENPKFKLREENIQAIVKLLQGFFSTAPEGIGRAQPLALALASRSRLLRDYLGEELARQEKEHKEGRLFGLFQVFKEQIFHELTVKDFSDAFAQMLAYGLFLARLNSGKTIITLHNAREYVPGSFRLIRELVDFLTELDKKEYREVRWVVEEVVSLINNLDLEAIHKDLSFSRRKAINSKVRAGSEDEHRLFERDPFIYFYENYLKVYDKEMRERRGVYYTPPPVVSFIVRAVDDILKDSFNVRDGLGGKGVTVLDFACGTGTFLLEVIERIFDNIGGSESGRADLVVRDHILKNLFGFEYLIAPYTIAHLKLSQYLKDKGHPLTESERLKVFLTNTLEPIEPQKQLLLPAVTAEVEEAQKVKDRDILVIVGNPPYSARSKNKGAWIKEKIKPYQIVDGKHFKEKKHWLNDDYVKFIRFAQLKMEARGEGIIGIISNRWWLENVTFRGMRQSILNTFDQVYIFDLQGEMGNKDDKNVFDITKGVAIALLIKNPGLEKKLNYFSLKGERLHKYQVSASSNLSDLPWETLSPSSPNYFLVPRSEKGRESYEAFPKISEIFPEGSTGVLTARDELATSISKPGLIENLKILKGNLRDQDIYKRFGLKKVEHWSLPNARMILRAEDIKKALVRNLAYRPFDIRFYYNHDALVFRRRNKIMQHMGSGRIGLTVCRLTKGGVWGHSMVANEAVDDSFISDRSKERAYLYPLYLDTKRHENISPDFRAFLDARYEHHYTPEEILGYIYAVLHAPSYRKRYAEFLRIDFPRVPFPETGEEFETLSSLGWALVEAHLLRDVPHQNLAAYHGKGDHAVEAVCYAPEEQAIYINKTQHFKPVPQPIWDFYIGGYRVLDKYLKSRKDRIMSLDEINHVRAVTDSLAFTIAQMEKIDKIYAQTFVERG